MRIGYVLPSLANKGPVIVARNLANELYGRGHSVDVYYLDDKFGALFNCPAIKLNMGELPDFDAYDILHSHGYRPDKLLYRIRKRLKHAKIVSTLHAHLEEDLAFSYNKIVSAIFAPLWLNRLKKFDRVVTITHFLAHVYCTRFSKLTTVYNGVTAKPDISKADGGIVAQMEVLKRKNSLKLIGAYAFITKRKGLHQVIELLPEKKDWVMVIIGEGTEKENLKKLTVKKGVKDRVLFFPYLKEPYNYLPLFDLYAMPSYSEGFGMSLVEAAEGGVPVVCSDIAVFRELFDDRQVSFFTLDDQRSLSMAIDTAYDNGKALAEQAFNKAISTYTVAAMANGYMRLYNELTL